MKRKPTKKDIMRGCMAFFKDMIISVFLFEFERAKFDWDMFRITAKGDFEVIDEN